MFLTPKKQTNTDKGSLIKSPPKTVTITPSVRRSIGEWEAAGTSETTHVSPITSKKDQAGPAKPRATKALSQDCELGRRSPTEQKTSLKTFANRALEARACLNKAKLHLNNSRNLKSDIKSGVIEAIDRLYWLVKESEQANKGTEGKGVSITQIPHTETQTDENTKLNNNLFLKLQETVEHIRENNKRMEQLKETIERRETLENNIQDTYANVTAAMTNERKGLVGKTALHSIVIASEDENETGEKVLDKIRDTVDAKEGWVKVERVRKAKDRKIIVSCRTKEERRKIKERIESSNKRLTCEEVSNKDPLLILRDVLVIHSDEDILKAIKNQNELIFQNLDTADHRMAIKYRKKARNPLTNHVVITTSPAVWKRVTDIGTLHIDLQRIRAEDQSPLVQCTRCLGYGHGKRFCKEDTDLCSHCGGPHLKSDCTEWVTGVPPSCKNCIRAKHDQRDHNAFSQACPVRQKWDIMARSSFAYC